MTDPSLKDDEMPSEIDFGLGVRGLHHIPPAAKVFMPASIERNVLQYFAHKAEQEGVALSQLLTDVLKRGMPVSKGGLESD